MKHIVIAAACLMFVAWKSTQDVPRNIEWSVTSTVETNTVDERTYNTRTNGHVWAERAKLFPQGYLGGVYNGGGITGLVVYATNVLNYYGYGASGPDPFKEKVEITYFTVIRKELYQINVGPFTDDYGTVFTVLDRWKKVHRQKLNMIENTETIKE